MSCSQQQPLFSTTNETEFPDYTPLGGFILVVFHAKLGWEGLVKRADCLHWGLQGSVGSWQLAR